VNKDAVMANTKDVVLIITLEKADEAKKEKPKSTKYAEKELRQIVIDLVPLDPFRPEPSNIKS
jgi:hypothetical protein